MASPQQKVVTPIASSITLNHGRKNDKALAESFGRLSVVEHNGPADRPGCSANNNLAATSGPARAGPSHHSAPCFGAIPGGQAGPVATMCDRFESAFGDRRQNLSTPDATNTTHWRPWGVPRAPSILEETEENPDDEDCPDPYRPRISVASPSDSPHRCVSPLRLPDHLLWPMPARPDFRPKRSEAFYCLRDPPVPWEPRLYPWNPAVEDLGVAAWCWPESCTCPWATPIGPHNAATCTACFRRPYVELNPLVFGIPCDRQF